MTLPLAARRILVVEDEFLIADEMAEALSAHGAQVVGPAPSVVAALDLIEREAALDHAVLDINLRGQTVFPVAEALWRRAVPFIFTTGYDTALIPPPFANVPRLIKPLRPETVVAILAE